MEINEEEMRKFLDVVKYRETLFRIRSMAFTARSMATGKSAYSTGQDLFDVLERIRRYCRDALEEAPIPTIKRKPTPFGMKKA